jgi:hypothetical protein
MEILHPAQTCDLCHGGLAPEQTFWLGIATLKTRQKPFLIVGAYDMLKDQPTLFPVPRCCSEACAKRAAEQQTADAVAALDRALQKRLTKIRAPQSEN